MRALCLSLLFLFAGSALHAKGLVIFAAASLQDGLEAALADWPGEATVSYAGTSVLARQIQNGAPADVFLSASVDWMDVLEQDQLIQPGTRRDLLGNVLVLVAHDPDMPAVSLGPDSDIVHHLDDGILATALTDAVPAGIYGKEALTNLGVWSQLRPQIAQTDNVRAALRLVERGEARMGIVYQTDARAAAVSVVAKFPSSLHTPIRYPAAVITASQHPEAEAFLDYLASAAGLAHFRAAGFQVLP